jgi:hypothetical protein
MHWGEKLSSPSNASRQFPVSRPLGFFDNELASVTLSQSTSSGKVIRSSRAFSHLPRLSDGVTYCQQLMDRGFQKAACWYGREPAQT